MASRPGLPPSSRPDYEPLVSGTDTMSSLCRIEDGHEGPTGAQPQQRKQQRAVCNEWFRECRSGFRCHGCHRRSSAGKQGVLQRCGCGKVQVCKSCVEYGYLEKRNEDMSGPLHEMPAEAVDWSPSTKEERAPKKKGQREKKEKPTRVVKIVVPKSKRPSQERTRALAAAEAAAEATRELGLVEEGPVVAAGTDGHKVNGGDADKANNGEDHKQDAAMNAGENEPEPTAPSLRRVQDPVAQPQAPRVYQDAVDTRPQQTAQGSTYAQTAAPQHELDSCNTSRVPEPSTSGPRTIRPTLEPPVIQSLPSVHQLFDRSSHRDPFSSNHQHHFWDTATRPAAPPALPPRGPDTAAISDGAPRQTPYSREQPRFRMANHDHWEAAQTLRSLDRGGSIPASAPTHHFHPGPQHPLSSSNGPESSQTHLAGLATVLYHRTLHAYRAFSQRPLAACLLWEACRFGAHDDPGRSSTRSVMSEQGVRAEVLSQVVLSAAGWLGLADDQQVRAWLASERERVERMAAPPFEQQQERRWE